MDSYQSHPEYLALLRAVLEHPCDDAPRWIITDWLEEAGEEARADFIRTQLKSARTSTIPNGRELRDHSHSLLQRHGVAWASEGGTIKVESGKWSAEPFNVRLAGIECLFNRGFVWQVRLSCKHFMRHASGLFRSHPVLRVLLTDKAPVNLRGQWRWNLIRDEDQFEFESHEIPLELESCFDETHRVSDSQGLRTQTRRQSPLYCHFLSPTKAANGLSAACVSYGRRIVGLPPAPWKALMSWQPAY